MSDLFEQERNKINAIDDEMKALFIKRMEAAASIGEKKKEAGLPVLDEKREKAMKERLLADVSNELKPYYEDFLESLLRISKDYQSR